MKISPVQDYLLRVDGQKRRS